MRKAQEFIAFAEQCEQMAKKLPEHSAALLEIAAAWRRLADKADSGETERLRMHATPRKELPVFGINIRSRFHGTFDKQPQWTSKICL